MSRDIAALVASMTVEEKAAFTAGADFWTLVANERVGIPPIRVTDGPNGARGSALFGLGGETAVCVPCGSALGATWDPELVERVGAMLGEEALTKACRVLLAPTVNLHRSPLGGRNFECYSEDPLLSGKTAAAFVRGVQSEGVVTTVKHFAGNDAEFERQSINSVIDARTLRELTLVPFELAVREGGALGIMTAYNRLNGPHCSEHHQLITEILRGEWGFEGFVLTDWLSAGSTNGSSAAGLDLEMPGPGAFYGKVLGDAVAAGDVPESELDEHVTHLLQVFDRTGALDDDPDWASTSIDRPEHRVLAREAATAATVLLRNDTRQGDMTVLPLDRSKLRTLAVLGPNAERPQMMGGGSANLAPHYEISLLDALRDTLGDDVEVRFERGVDIDRTTAPLYAPFAIEYFAGSDLAGEPVARGRYRNGKLLVVDPLPDGVAVRRVLVPRHRHLRRPTRPARTRSPWCSWEGAGGSCSTVRCCSTGSPTRPVPVRSSSDSPAPRRSRRSSSRRARPSRSSSSSRSRPTRSSCAASRSVIAVRARPICSTAPSRPRRTPTR